MYLPVEAGHGRILQQPLGDALRTVKITFWTTISVANASPANWHSPVGPRLLWVAIVRMLLRLGPRMEFCTGDCGRFGPAFRLIPMG